MPVNYMDFFRKESEVRRILNPRHNTKADTLERFIRSLGGDVLVSARQEVLLHRHARHRHQTPY